MEPIEKLFVVLAVVRLVSTVAYLLAREGADGGRAAVASHCYALPTKAIKGASCQSLPLPSGTKTIVALL
jgi:hypothetical protein